MQKIVIYGAGQIGAMVAEMLHQRGEVEVVGFIDDDPGQMGRVLGGIEVMGDASLLPRLLAQGVSGAIVSIGSNRVRRRIADRLTDARFELINAVHPSAIISESARLGKGNIVAAGVVICTNTVIGDNVYIGPGAVVSHDVAVGDNVLLSIGSMLAGRSDVASGAFIGAGACVVPAQMSPDIRLRVGRNAVVGAGAVVLEDVPDNAVVVGVPARVVRYRDPEAD